ncbi:MAG: diaminopimelate epimerase [Lachnospiraceae bacterium]|nr:diaminopimelate epimerase [Lachnospiraceae bacterium]
MQLSFVKMQGCGNDYIYIDCVQNNPWRDVSSSVPDKSELAIRLSDRHFGIGSDGLIFINRSDLAGFEMEMYNADGSRGKMCGNGMRCVAKLIYDRGYVNQDEFTVESMGAIKKVKVFPENGVVKTVTVDMGVPELVPANIPVNTGADSSDPIIGGRITAGSVSGAFTAVSMGNPHAVIFTDSLNISVASVRDLDLASIGPSFEHHEYFPERVNTEFVRVLDKNNVEMRVWERGSGETLACGTGCCAVVAACVLNKRTERRINVHLLGGTLDVYWNETDSHIYMTGPAETVFTGLIDC